MLELLKKRKGNWLGHWLRRNCLLKDALEGMVNGNKVRGRRRYQMIYNIMKNGLCRYKKEGWEEGREENAQFAVKDLPLVRTLWLIYWLTYKFALILLVPNASSVSSLKIASADWLQRASSTTDRKLPDHQELQGGAKTSSGDEGSGEDQLGRPTAHLLSSDRRPWGPSGSTSTDGLEATQTDEDDVDWRRLYTDNKTINQNLLETLTVT